MKKLTDAEMVVLDRLNTNPIPIGSIVRFIWTKRRALQAYKDEERDCCKPIYTISDFKMMVDSLEKTVANPSKHFLDQIIIEPHYIYPEWINVFYERPMLVLDRWTLSAKGYTYPSKEVEEAITSIFRGAMLLVLLDEKKYWVDECYMEPWPLSTQEKKK